MTSRLSPETMLSGFFEQNPRSAALARALLIEDSVLLPFIRFDGDRFVLDVGDENVLDETDLPAGEEVEWIVFCLARAVYKTPPS